MRECWEMQECGEKLRSYDLWASFGLVLVNVGSEGERILRELDEIAMGADLDENKTESFIENARGVRPTKCSTLGSRAGVDLLRCGRAGNPCGFPGENSPFHHGTSAPCAKPSQGREIGVVETEIKNGIKEFFK